MERSDAAVLRANSWRPSRVAEESIGLSRSGVMASKAVPPRVLFLFTEVFANGGIQRFNRTILDACDRLGIHCRVLSLNDSTGIGRTASRIRHRSVAGFSGHRWRFALAVARVMLRGRFDRLLIGHINFLVLAVALKPWRPVSSSTNDAVAHGIEVWSGIGRTRRYALSRMARVLCVSRYTRQRILEQTSGAGGGPIERFSQCTCGILESGCFRARVASSVVPHFILSVTRLERGDRYKGIATVIEAFSMLADDTMHYYIIGRGNDLSFLQRAAERCGVQNRVHFLRGVDDSELTSLYRNCAAFVLPSGKEGFGIVFLEAMFFGAPVIAAREKGALDVVRDGETGLRCALATRSRSRKRLSASCRIQRCANDYAPTAPRWSPAADPLHLPVLRVVVRRYS